MTKYRAGFATDALSGKLKIIYASPYPNISIPPFASAVTKLCPTLHEGAPLVTFCQWNNNHYQHNVTRRNYPTPTVYWKPDGAILLPNVNTYRSSSLPLCAWLIIIVTWFLQRKHSYFVRRGFVNLKCSENVFTFLFQKQVRDQLLKTQTAIPWRIQPKLVGSSEIIVCLNQWTVIQLER